jgi:hypothetical protein
MKKACQSCPYFSLAEQQRLIAEINGKMEGILKLTEVIYNKSLVNEPESRNRVRKLIEVGKNRE